MPMQKGWLGRVEIGSPTVSHRFLRQRPSRKTIYSDFIGGLGLLTAARIRHTRFPLSWRPASADNRHWAKLPENPANITWVIVVFDTAGEVNFAEANPSTTQLVERALKRELVLTSDFASSISFGEQGMGLLPATLGIGSDWTRWRLLRHLRPLYPAPAAWRLSQLASPPHQK